MKIIDNFLDEQDFIRVSKSLMNPEFPWYMDSVNHSKFIDVEEEDNYQFTHLFYNSYFSVSNYINIIDPIINKINPVSFVRIKANLNPRTHKNIEHGFHVDFFAKNIKTAIWYANTNDGYTLFEDGTKIESIANRFVEFDCHMKHTGSTTTNAKARVLINFNYFVKE